MQIYFHVYHLVKFYVPSVTSKIAPFRPNCFLPFLYFYIHMYYECLNVKEYWSRIIGWLADMS